MGVRKARAPDPGGCRGLLGGFPVLCGSFAGVFGRLWGRPPPSNRQEKKILPLEGRRAGTRWDPGALGWGDALPQVPI